MTKSELLSQTEHISDIFTKLILKSMAASLSDKPGPEDITFSQLQALKYVWQHGPCTIGSLAQGLGVSQPAATMLVDRMAKRGLVERHPGQSDRRQAEVSLTPRAGSLIERVEAERAEHLAKILSLMGPSDRERFVELLERFISAALKLESAVDEACLRCGIEHHTGCVVNRMHVERVGRDVERI